jgi:outer membrane protein assembly factor BamB
MSCSGGDATATGRVVIAGAVLRPDGDGYTRHVTSRGLTPSDGSTTWRRTNKRASEGRAGVLISPDGRTALVSELVSAGEERWLALATSTGHQQWSTTPVGIGGIWSPNGSRVYVRETNTRSDQGQIERAYDGATGDLLWRTNDRTLADYNDMVAVPGRLLLVGQRFFWIEAPCGCEADLETQTWIVSLSARDGSREWRVPFGERGRHQPGVARTDAGVDVDPSRPETAYIAGKLWPNGFASAFMTS